MKTDQSENSAPVPKKVKVAKRIGTVGALLLGLSLYALFSEDPGAIYPELENPVLVYGLLAFSIMAIAAEQVIKAPYYRSLKQNEQTDEQKET